MRLATTLRASCLFRAYNPNHLPSVFPISPPSLSRTHLPRRTHVTPTSHLSPLTLLPLVSSKRRPLPVSSSSSASSGGARLGPIDDQNLAHCTSQDLAACPQLLVDAGAVVDLEDVAAALESLPSPDLKARALRQLQRIREGAKSGTGHSLEIAGVALVVDEKGLVTASSGMHSGAIFNRLSEFVNWSGGESDKEGQVGVAEGGVGGQGQGHSGGGGGGGAGGNSRNSGHSSQTMLESTKNLAGDIKRTLVDIGGGTAGASDASGGAQGCGSGGDALVLASPSVSSEAGGEDGTNGRDGDALCGVTNTWREMHQLEKLVNAFAARIRGMQNKLDARLGLGGAGASERSAGGALRSPFGLTGHGAEAERQLGLGLGMGGADGLVADNWESDSLQAGAGFGDDDLLQAEFHGIVGKHHTAVDNWEICMKKMVEEMTSLDVYEYLANGEETTLVTHWREELKRLAQETQQEILDISRRYGTENGAEGGGVGLGGGAGAAGRPGLTAVGSDSSAFQSCMEKQLAAVRNSILVKSDQAKIRPLEKQREQLNRAFDEMRELIRKVARERGKLSRRLQNVTETSVARLSAELEMLENPSRWSPQLPQLKAVEAKIETLNDMDLWRNNDSLLKELSAMEAKRTTWKQTLETARRVLVEHTASDATSTRAAGERGEAKDGSRGEKIISQLAKEFEDRWSQICVEESMKQIALKQKERQYSTNQSKLAREREKARQVLEDAEKERKSGKEAKAVMETQLEEQVCGWRVSGVAVDNCR